MKIFTDPLLLDFLSICINMPEDERKQLEAFTGEPYSVDGAAIGNFTVLGPKWVIKTNEGVAVCVGGFVPQRPGVYRDFMLTTPEAWTTHWFAVTRICRRALTAMMEGGAHRLECIVPATRLAYRPQIETWYKAIGYTREATLYRYLADGSDAVVFARVRH
jgi:hypothetical protein